LIRGRALQGAIVRRTTVVAVAVVSIASFVWLLSSCGGAQVARKLDEARPGRPSFAAPLSSTRSENLGSPAEQAIRWRSSTSVGLPWSGKLVRGVQLPSEDRLFFTWDPVKRRSPNRGWRRWGNHRLLRTTLRVLAGYSHDHPDAPRVGIGDLSRPSGGDFGPRFGRPGHASHQNGLDIDVYYPRRDGLERAPRTPAEVDRALAQELVDRFVEAGAQFVFVGYRVGLNGPAGIVQKLPRHDNHLHVRVTAID
jgi:hypothetical protein